MTLWLLPPPMVFLLVLVLAITGVTPVLASDSISQEPTAPMTPPAALTKAAYYIYKEVISPANGSVCPMHPTCSRYAVDAAGRHGKLEAQ